MAFCGEGMSREKVEASMEEYEKREGWDSCKGVIIENNSQYQLEYASCGQVSGCPVTPVGDMFTVQDDGTRVIPPKSSAGMLWRLHKGGNFGKWVGDIFSLGIATAKDQAHVNAYISVKARIPGKNHIIALGFTQGRNRADRAGIEIRAEDGVLDESGNVSGHGIDPTGKVSDIPNLSTTKFVETFKKNGIAWHEFSEESRTLKIRCQQTNEWLGRVVFTFYDGHTRS